MDRQLWKLQRLKNPAVLGMALTLASTSGVLAIEPEISQETDKLEIELYDETLKNNEKAIAKLPDPIQSEVLTNELFSESDRGEEIDFTALEIEEISREQNWEDFDRPIASDEGNSIDTTKVEAFIETETRETWPEFLTEADILRSPQSAEIEEVTETWPEFLTEADLRRDSPLETLRDRSNTNMSNDDHKTKVIKNIATIPAPETEIASFEEELAQENVAEEAIAESENPEDTEENGLQDILDEIEQYHNEPRLRRRGSSQFEDVSPSDWVFQAFNDLVQRYDCLKGYPDNIYRGDRTLSRYEFAVSLNICIQQIEGAIASSTVDLTRQDLETIQRLTQEVERELALLNTLAERTSFQDILEGVQQYSNESIEQGNFGASQFRDVSPGDWAFQALDDLVRRYDCLKGYPNGTYRGDRPLTRYEFAAGLNACIQQVERLIAASTADFMTRQDLEVIQRLVQEFETELATLSTRVDNLESRVAFLEAHQFSTTTKLSGEAILALTDNFDGGSSVTNNILTVVSETAFGNRVRLALNTSFTGRDRLVTRLRAGNLQAYRSGSLSFLNNTSSFVATQTFNVPDSESSNDVLIDWLGYYFQSGNSQAYVAATGGKWSDIAPTLNPYFEDFDGGNGSLSTFAQRNPIFRIGGGSGAALSFGFTPIENLLGPSTITLGYFAGSDAATPGAGLGLFNGDYAAMGRLNVNVSDRLAVGLTYIHGYHAGGSPIYAEGRSRTGGLSALVGSYAANNPWVLLDNNDGGIPMATNSYGGEISLRITDGLIVNGAMTYTNAILLDRGNADIWSYSLGIALPDFFKEGDVWALYAGMQPTMKGIRASGLVRDRGRTDPIWHLEGFYRFPITDNISITPGAVVVFNPNQNFSDHDDVIGTVRVTFSF